MTTVIRIQCVLLLVVALASCEGMRERPKVATTAVAGLLQSEIGGPDKGKTPVTAVGTLLAGYHQTKIGGLLVRADRRFAEATARKSLDSAPDGQTSNWRNPANGHAGTFKPINTYRSDDRIRCRDFVQSVTIDSRMRAADGTACLANGGVWRVVEAPITRHRTR